MVDGAHELNKIVLEQINSNKYIIFFNWENYTLTENPGFYLHFFIKWKAFSVCVCLKKKLKAFFSFETVWFLFVLVSFHEIA